MAPRIRVALSFRVGLVLVALTAPTLAAERELEEAPAPTSAREIESPLERAFLRPARKEPLLPWMREQLESLPPFFADTELEARFRTYYLYKDRGIDVLNEACAGRSSVPPECLPSAHRRRSAFGRASSLALT